MNHRQPQRADAGGILNLCLGSGPKAKPDRFTGGVPLQSRRSRKTAGNVFRLSSWIKNSPKIRHHEKCLAEQTREGLSGVTAALNLQRIISELTWIIFRLTVGQQSFQDPKLIAGTLLFVNKTKSRNRIQTPNRSSGLVVAMFLSFIAAPLSDTQPL